MSDFYLVLPSNSSMGIHPNNTLAQYITNLPRRISLRGDWECGLTEIHYPHDWYNVRNARLMVEHNNNNNNNCRNGSCLTWLATSLEEKRRWLIIDASPRGQCSK